jgi:hypothetical protein
MIWTLQGTEAQQRIVRDALAACDFPFDQMLPSLQREGKTGIVVEWADLSRYTHGAAGHEHADGAHTIVREVDGRARVLGLFYLPPHTKVVLDNALVDRPLLAQEVFLAEAAHAADYHWMVERGLRRAVWNALHGDDHDTDAPIPEAGDVGHGHSWFDGPGGYSTWVGESWMAAFVKAYAPSIPVTINLAHPVTDAAVQEIRGVFAEYLPAPEHPDVDPLAGFPYGQLDAWAARRAFWWARYAKTAADAYLAWRG